MERLDKEIVNRGLVNSRSKAQELISNKCIYVNDKVIVKNNYPVSSDDNIIIKDTNILKYVSRGGLKLEGAIKSFKLDFKDKVIMDIGSSTGGFTDCSLKYGAKKVIAIDVGTDLMVDSLRTDNRIVLYEQLNIKDAKKELFKDIDIIVSDVSFISLKHIIDKISSIDKSFLLVFLIKPQFECGKEIATKYKGVIRDKEIHYEILKDLVNYFKDKEYYLYNLDVSPIHGGDGNIEYLACFGKDKDKIEKVNYKEIVNKAFNY